MIVAAFRLTVSDAIINEVDPLLGNVNRLAPFGGSHHICDLHVCDIDRGKKVRPGKLLGFAHGQEPGIVTRVRVYLAELSPTASV